MPYIYIYNILSSFPTFIVHKNPTLFFLGGGGGGYSACKHHWGLRIHYVATPRSLLYSHLMTATTTKAVRNPDFLREWTHSLKVSGWMERCSYMHV